MVKSCPYLQAKCSQKQKKVTPPVPCTLPWAVKRSKAHPLSPVKSVKAKGQRSKARERETWDHPSPLGSFRKNRKSVSVGSAWWLWSIWIYDSYGSMDLSNLHNRPPVPTAKELKAARRRTSAQDSRQGASGHGVATCCDACRESCCMGKVETDSVNVGSPLTGKLKDWITQSFFCWQKLKS